jgi:8-amino-7-oxononanoate synthase
LNKVNLENWISEALALRYGKGLLRELKTTTGLIDFYSNDYLGLARSEELSKLITERVELQKEKLNGATGSRLLSGNSLLTEDTERKLATIFKSASALIFNSGYTANLAVLSSIPQRGDTIIYDELIHTCVKDGARLSLANRHSFKHNDLLDLEEKIKRSKGRIFIAVESIYSMDGDECPLADLVKISEKYNACIILDEAHSTGVTGVNGGGLAVSLGLEDKIEIRIYTFGKAMGCHGACVTGSKNLTNYLVNFARPFIYTTALPPHSIITIASAFDFLRQNIHLQNELHKKIALFKSIVPKSISVIESHSSIQAILLAGNDNARNTARHLQQSGYDIRPILSPTVPEGEERLRICLHVYNDDTEINNLTGLLV